MRHGICVVKQDGFRRAAYTATAVWGCLGGLGVETLFIEPGSTLENGYTESFNGKLRDGCLNRWAFMSVREARLIVESWRREYNEGRPHGALNQITPVAYAAGEGTGAEGSGLRFKAPSQP